jgi:tRNA pseudouridine13 synthase
MVEQLMLANALRPPTVGDGPRPGGIIKLSVEHFRVVELPVTAPSGNGSHLWLEIERSGMNTEYVARQLAAVAAVPARDIGFAGLKDRHALTRQWFSVPGHENDELLVEPLAQRGLRVTSSGLHERKLRRGALKGNRFRIFVLSASNDDGELLDHLAMTKLVNTNAQVVRERGVPNYFGPQRFGRHGNNLNHAQRMLCEGQRVRERHRRGLYLSAARSALFNQVLASRVRDGSWAALLAGEAVVLDGSASFFLADPQDVSLSARLDAFDIHPSGPLIGDGETPATDLAARVEITALLGCESLMTGLRSQRMESARRALRVRVADLRVDQTAQDGWWLEFSLPAGAYATMVLREIFDIADGSRIVAEGEAAVQQAEQ